MEIIAFDHQLETNRRHLDKNLMEIAGKKDQARYQLSKEGGMNGSFASAGV